ncbi:RNA polymerase sigma factor [Luteolibacter marinus]|uniref:RNA polymerase sigma factor n=1 Tax=Luteolibacter marinus TaxID=2776705 RepID=UPI001D0251A4|nr:sigma-70 family RNA polymerase sigma factor [Luteolibacter marinus]
MPAEARMSQENLTPDQLLIRASGGCADSFSQLYDLCSGALFGIALGISRNHAEAQEILQDAFVSIWKNAGRYDPSLGSATAWMIHLTRNLSIDRLRKRQRGDELHRKFSEERAVTDDDAEAPESPLIAAEVAQRVRKAMTGLPRDQQVALNLAFFEGRTQTEIATQLSEPLGTIKSRIRRAMDRVKHLMGENPITD